MKKKIFLLAVLFPIFINAQVNTFSFNINGTTPAGFVQALTIAGQKWSNYLQITVPVKVNVFTVNSSLLPFSAITLANGRKNFANAPQPNTLYVSTLANQIAGSEVNSGQYDMDIYFNLATSYYFGTGKPSASQSDFISTAMHEIGHGLGFYSDGYVDGSGKGSFGNIPPSSIFPLTPSFPWRGQDSVPSIYDKYIVKVSGNPLTTVAPDNSTALGDSIKNGALYFNGPLYANASHSNTPVRLAGGAGTYTLGVDLLHIHNTYAKTIMSYYWGAGDTVRTPAPWELGILKEIGWNLKAVGLKENNNYSLATSFPNPANTTIFINGKNIHGIRIYNPQGELVHEMINEFKADELIVDIKNLPEGIYFSRITFDNASQSAVKKIIVKH
ncbi:MAG: T9SS type A sorting domain-containing protein [Bacteroidota bacterium]|nr:T9SS type A sorting domain-containing protein [Bacteroidota bacterium]